MTGSNPFDVAARKLASKTLVFYAGHARKRGLIIDLLAFFSHLILAIDDRFEAEKVLARELKDLKIFYHTVVVCPDGCGPVGKVDRIAKELQAHCGGLLLPDATSETHGAMAALVEWLEQNPIPGVFVCEGGNKADYLVAIIHRDLRRCGLGAEVVGESDDEPPQNLLPSVQRPQAHLTVSSAFEFAETLDQAWAAQKLSRDVAEGFNWDIACPDADILQNASSHTTIRAFRWLSHDTALVTCYDAEQVHTLATVAKAEALLENQKARTAETTKKYPEDDGARDDEAKAKEAYRRWMAKSDVERENTVSLCALVATCLTGDTRAYEKNGIGFMHIFSTLVLNDGDINASLGWLLERGVPGFDSLREHWLAIATRVCIVGFQEFPL